MEDVPSIEVLGVPIACLDRDDALARIEALYESGSPALVFYANAHTLNLASRDAGYRSVLAKAALVLNDGSGVALAAGLRGRRFPANLNGTDFNPAVLERAAARGWPVYLLGGRPGVAEKAGRGLSAGIPGLKLAGTHHGYLDGGGTRSVLEEIRGSGAAVLMVAMGNPLQEQWLDEHLEASGAGLGVGVGAFFDFASGAVPRAPGWMKKLGLEWVYRLVLEPRRMWRRYLLGNPAFLLRVLKERALPSRAGKLNA